MHLFVANNSRLVVPAEREHGRGRAGTEVPPLPAVHQLQSGRHRSVRRQGGVPGGLRSVTSQHLSVKI